MLVRSLSLVITYDRVLGQDTTCYDGSSFYTQEFRYSVWHCCDRKVCHELLAAISPIVVQPELSAVERDFFKCCTVLSVLIFPR